MTTALEGGEGSTPRPGRFTPGKGPTTIAQEAGWAPGQVWASAENLVPTGIRSPDRPARNESLYQLGYPGPRDGVKKPILNPNGNSSFLNSIPRVFLLS